MSLSHKYHETIINNNYKANPIITMVINTSINGIKLFFYLVSLKKVNIHLKGNIKKI